MVKGGGEGGHSIASDLDDCARNMKLSKIHELHLHFACHAPFVANVTIAATVTVTVAVTVTVTLPLPPLLLLLFLRCSLSRPSLFWTFHISRSLCNC